MSEVSSEGLDPFSEGGSICQVLTELLANNIMFLLLYAVGIHTPQGLERRLETEFHILTSSIISVNFIEYGIHSSVYGIHSSVCISTMLI